jgi:hypothetical protein
MSPNTQEMMMSDKELLEMAAKAIGMTLRYNYLGGRDANQPWNPLTDDGDALRLAVELELFDLDMLLVDLDIHERSASHELDPYAATRRAIVRAAAELGEAKP